MSGNMASMTGKTKAAGAVGKAPAFQFYAADFLVGTAAMSAEEVGIYMRLLCYQWTHEGLPADDRVLRRVAGTRKMIPAAVLAKFDTGEDGMLRNPRLEAVRREQAEFRESRAESARKRWSGKQGQDEAAPGGEAVAETGANTNASASEVMAAAGVGRDVGVDDARAKVGAEVGGKFAENGGEVDTNGNAGSEFRNHFLDSKVGVKNGVSLGEADARAYSTHMRGACSSSSSSPSGEDKRESERGREPLVELDDALKFAVGNPGWRDEVVRDWYWQRDGQGWLRNSGVPVGNWRSDLKMWVEREARLPRGKQRHPPGRGGVVLTNSKTTGGFDGAW